jgi:hypothetical protein
MNISENDVEGSGEMMGDYLRPVTVRTIENVLHHSKVNACKCRK